ncbi:hypothetical protein MRX96_007252 [Rhipicephalus microplus]
MNYFHNSGGLQQAVIGTRPVPKIVAILAMDEDSCSGGKKKHIVAERVLGTVKSLTSGTATTSSLGATLVRTSSSIRRAMARNNAPKRMLRFGAGERVQFDILVGDKDHEPANVTALEGKPVQSTLYAANRRHFQHCGFHIITNEAAGERHAVAAERFGTRKPATSTRHHHRHCSWTSLRILAQDESQSATDDQPQSMDTSAVPPGKRWLLMVVCANAWRGCDFKGKFSILGNHLAFSCTQNVVKCRNCGRRIVRRYLCQHASTGGCSTTSTPDATEDSTLVWSPQFVNWSQQLVVPDWEQVSAARTNLVASATLNGVGLSVTVPTVGANHRNWPGRARPTLLEAPEPSGHLPSGSLTLLAGTLLVRLPDCTSPLGDAPKKTTESPVHSSWVEYFGSDQLVVDGFRLVMPAMIFYDFSPNTSCPCCNSPTALVKLVVFELLAKDDVKGNDGRRRRWLPWSSLALTINACAVTTACHSELAILLNSRCGQSAKGGREWSPQKPSTLKYSL